MPSPDLETNYDHTVEIVRHAIPRMAERKIPITPSNYAVWYEYLTASNQALREEMDALLARDAPITNREMQALYRRYLEERGESVELAKTALGQVIQALMDHLRQADGHYGGFSGELGDIAARLAGDTSVDELDALLERATRATRAALAHGTELRQRLTSLADRMEEVQARLARSQEEARSDALTGLDNRLAFQEALLALPQCARDDTHSPCLLLVDIDHFKRVNDTHGHPAGDRVLAEVAREIKASVRGRDTVARFGGEEFAVLLRDTPRSGCQAVAENLRQQIERTTIELAGASNGRLAVTVSVGGAWYREQEPAERLVERADRALYQSKRLGRNRVSWEGRRSDA